MATQLEVIKKFMASLDETTLAGTAALDEAIKACSSFKSFKELRNAMISDCKKAKSADDFLKTYCGINLDNEDTGAITGSDAGGSTTKTNESIVPESGSLKNFKKNSFTVNGLTIQLSNFDNDGNYLGDLNFNDLNDTQKYIWQALYTWWAKGALNLIAESYGDNFSFSEKSSATVKKISFGFYTSENNVGAVTGYSYNDGKTLSISMRVNMRFYNSLVDGGNPDGKSTITSSYLDTMLAHEFTHAVLAANINYNAQLPMLFTEGIAELTIGRDTADDMLELAANPTLLSKTLLSKDGTNPYGGGYMFLRYLARQAGDLMIINTSDSLVQTFKGNDDIRNFAVNAKINAGSGSDYIENYGVAKVSINGGAGDDSIMSHLNHNDHPDGCTLRGGDGNDYISNDDGLGSNLSGGVKVLIDGGNGNDTISNDGANSTLLGGAGHDSINNWWGSVTIDGGTGNDSILSGGDKVSIKGGTGNDSIYGGGNKVSISGGTGNDSIHSYGDKVKIAGDAGNDSIYLYANATNHTVNSGDGNDSIYSGGTNVSVNAGAGNDYIENYGSNSTINGGRGNDSVTSYSTDGVLYKYSNGDGKDTITGFNAADTLSIADVFFSTKASGSDLLVKVGKGSVLLKDAKKLTSNVVLSVTDSSKSPLTISSTVKNIDASKRTKAIQITGNKLANSIAGGSKNDILSGGGGNDTLRGGKGNDKLWGDAGSDTFIYGSGEGKDIIYGFDNDDMLLITGAFKASYNKSNDAIYFKVGSTKNAITLKNFDATTFNINGDVYRISGKKLVK